MTLIELEQGWMVVQKLITKLEETLESKSPEECMNVFTSEEYMDGYNTVYYMCTQKPPHNYSKQMYRRYQKTQEDYLSSTVVPRLREKSGESLLEELVQRWFNHKIMLRWLRNFFGYLDRYFINARNSRLSVHEFGINCFRDKVCDALNGEVVDAVITAVEKVRGGEKIDRALYKNVADVIPLISHGESHGALLKNVADVLGHVYRGYY